MLAGRWRVVGCRTALRSLAIAIALAATGCGGGSPLLHPAHVNGPGVFSFGAGASGQMAVRDVGGEASDTGQLQDATVAPGVAPWVAGRVGIRGSNEAGLTYTGRTVRLDARHAFDLGGPALSVGAGASAIFPQRPGYGDSKSRLYGGSLDVPVLFGVRTRSDLYALWFGPRAGFGVIGGSFREVLPPQPNTTAEFRDVEARHFHGGLVVGMRAGFRHLHVAIEVDGTYHHVEGALGGTDAAIDQVTVTPAGALVLTF
jgi:hypothetical protein